jgi:hypothetical protein
LNSNTSYSGHFEILDFDREKQFVNPDLEKLSQLATQTKELFIFLTKWTLIKSLLKMIIIKQLKKTDNTISVDRLDFTV